MKKFWLSYMLVMAVCFFHAVSCNAETGTYEHKSFFSEALGTEKNYWVSLPPGYENTHKKYPVVYLLHGYNFARNNPDVTSVHEEENHWVMQERIPQITGCLFTSADYDLLLECMKTEGVEFPEAVVHDMKEEYGDSILLPLSPVIFVMPDGDSSFYLDRADGQKQWPPLEGPEFVDGVRKGATGQYETYVYKDLVGHIDNTYRTLDTRDKRGIGGFSMGGIGSMNLLLAHPDVYVSVSSFSAMFTLKDMLGSPLAQGMSTTTPEIARLFSADPSDPKSKIDENIVTKFDPYYRLRDFSATDVFIYYDAGDGDFFAGMNNFKTFEKFEKGLVKKGIKSYPSKHIIPGSEINGKGMHTGAYWRSRVGVMVVFHLKAFGLM